MQTNIYYLSDNLTKLRTMPDNSVDSIVTDSPYGLGKPPDMVKMLTAWLECGYYEVKGKGFMGKEWDRFVPQPIFWKECLRVLKPGGYLLSFFGTRTYDYGTMAIRLAGFEVRDCIQWIYGSGFPKSKSSLKPANEPICVARKPGPLSYLNIDECRIDGLARRKIISHGKDSKNCYGNGLSGSYAAGVTEESRYPTNVFIDECVSYLMDGQDGVHVDKDAGGPSRFFYVAKASPKERNGSKHPTIKPVKLMEQLVKLVTPVGGTCLDPHGGSGTTAEACINTGRNYILIDNDSQSVIDGIRRGCYCDIPEDILEIL